VNTLGVSLLALLAGLIICLPRRWAPVPIILCAAYVTRGQVLDAWGANFTVLRLLIGIGVVRVLLRGERLEGGVQTADLLMLIWAALLLFASLFHTNDAWLYRSGLIWSDLGCYLLLRIFITDSEDVYRNLRFVSIALIPLAAEMIYEKTTGVDLFGVLGGINEDALIRGGVVRAAGSFAHPILAGSVGAACASLGVVLWHRSRFAAAAGLAAGLAMIYASTSSGPILMFLFFLLAFALWPWRRFVRLVRYGLLVGVVLLDVVMKDPFYFVLARIDLTGSSAGWHRAQLIRSSLEHLSEWWLAGTDYTRHWMPSGITANEIHTDMTNHILTMGVLGGLPLLLVFVLLIATGFRRVGRVCTDHSTSYSVRVLWWGLGALLLAFTMNFMTITLFDHSVVFLWLVLSLIHASSKSATSKEAAESAAPSAHSGANGVQGTLITS
jgi:hypothetical protein